LTLITGANDFVSNGNLHVELAPTIDRLVEHENPYLQAQLELDRNRLSDSFAQAPAAMALLSGPDHRFLFANAAYLKLSGRKLDQVLGKPIREVLPEIQEQGFVALLNRVYQTHEPFVASAREMRLNRDGKEETIFVDFTYHPMRNMAGKVEGILFQGVNVTEELQARTRLEARVKERTVELEQAEDTLRALNRRLLEVQDEERRRLALELHDSAGQWLAALKWKMALLVEDIAPQSTELAERVSECLTLLNELTKELRTLSHLLHPPMLDDAGLSPALRSYVEGFAERSGLTVNLELEREVPRLPREVETAVFRIVQESLTNIHRHARTQTAMVRIGHDSENVRVEIRDRGDGIVNFTSLDDTLSKMGVGLRGMRERVRLLDGKFELQSGNWGTTVTATLPIRVRPLRGNVISA
jgi:PAS domain S-box-containing protein